MSHRILAAGGVAALVAAATVAHAATTSRADHVIEGCIKTSSGALRIHAIVITPKTYSCRSGEKSVVWNEQGRRGPAGETLAYIGRLKAADSQSYFNGKKVKGTQVANLMAMTSILPHGVYTVSSTAAVSLVGGGNGGDIRCYLSPVSASPHNDLDDGERTNASAYLIEDSLTITDQFVMSGDQRLGLYCENIGDGSAPAEVSYAQLTATRVNQLVMKTHTFTHH